MKKKSAIFLILFLISFCASFFLFKDKIDTPYFRGLNKKISIDVILKNEKTTQVISNKGFKQIKIDKNHYLFEQNGYSNIQKINFENTENIEKLIIYNGLDANFIKEIKNEYLIDNSKPILDKMAIVFLSFFYNFQFYLLSYLFLILFLNSINLNIKRPLLLFLALSLFLRLSQINSIPFWDDEIYVLASVANYSPLSALFDDFGNPPLYFIYFKLYSLVVKNPEFFRYSSVIIGLIFNYLFYIYLKNNFGKKQANLGLFLVSINIILIYYSQELRSYILLMLFNILSAICLFKFNLKNKFLYFIATFGLIMTHYYGAFLFLYNSIFGLILFWKNKSKTKVFVFLNLILLIILITMCFLKHQGLTTSFNDWIDKPTINDVIMSIKIFCPVLIFAVFVGILPFIFSKTEKKIQRITILYNFGAILGVFLMSAVFSNLIKPIFYYKYFYSVFPNFLVLATIVIAFNYKIKIKILIQTILFILFLTMQRVNYQNLYCNHNLYLEFIKNDVDISKTNYVFLTDTVQSYREFDIEGVKMIYLPVNIGIEDIDLTKYDSRPFVAYVLNLYLNEATIQKAEKIELYKTPLGVFTKAEFN